MRKLLFALVMTTSLVTFAQARKGKTRPTNTTADTSIDSFELSGSSEVTAKLGFVAQAINIGADYNKMSDGSGIGGYFFYQTSKKSGNAVIVPGMMSFGGTYKMNLVDTNKMLAYVTPGFGIHMGKDVGVSSTGSSTDETLIGPVMKIGAQLKVNPTFVIGLERQDIVNWFKDNVSGGFTYYSVATTFWF